MAVLPHATRDAPPADGASPTAAAILRLGSDHDGQAWAFLADTYGRRIHHLGRRILGSGSAADDGLQQVCLQLHAVAHRFQADPHDPEPKAIAWLMQVATRTLVHCARAESRRRRREAAVVALPHPIDAQDGEDPRLPALRAALARLPARYREVVHLRYDAGLSASDLALALGCSRIASRLRLYRALGALRAQLAAEGVSCSAMSLQGLLAEHGPSAGIPATGDPLAVLDRLFPRSRRSARMGSASLAVVLIAALIGAVGCQTQRQDAPRGDAPRITWPLPPSTWGRLHARVAWRNVTLAQIQTYCEQVLRIPLVIDPAVLATARTWSEMHATARVDQLLWFIAAEAGARSEALPSGGWRLVPGTPPPHGGTRTLASCTALPPLALDGDPQTALRAALQGLPSVDPQAIAQLQVVDRRAIHVRLPAVSAHGDAVLRALAGGAIGDPTPQDRFAHRTWSGGWGTLPLPVVIGRLAAASELPCRLEAHAGPWPQVRREDHWAVRTGDLLVDLANAAWASCSEATDGMVIYRPLAQAWDDAQGLPCDGDGLAYAQHRAPWWSLQDRCAAPYPQIVVSPLGHRLLTVDWRGASLAHVAQDLHAALGVAVELTPVVPAPRIFLALPERTLDEVLTLLAAATGLCWELDGRVIVARVQTAPPGPVRAAAAVPRPLAPMPAPGAGAAAQDVRGWPLPAAQWGLLQVAIPRGGLTLAEIQAVFQRVLHVGLAIDPAVRAHDLPCVDLWNQRTPLEAVLRAIALQGDLTQMHLLRESAGGWRLASGDVATLPDPWYPPLWACRALPPLVIDGDPEPALRAAVQAFPMVDHAFAARLQVADRRPIHVRLRAVDGEGPEVLAALAGGAIGDLLPQDRLAQQPWSGTWGELPLPAVLARIAARSGLPCRLDDASGPWPVVRRATADPVRVGDLLDALAEAAWGTCSQAADGMVLYRMPLPRAIDAPGQATADEGVPFRELRARRPWIEALGAAQTAQPVVTSRWQRLIVVHWQAAPLAQVAQDLQTTLGVPVVLAPDLPRIPVSLTLPERTVAEILTLLRAATGCAWGWEGERLHVRRLPPGSPAVAPHATGMHAAPPSPDPQLPVSPQ